MKHIAPEAALLRAPTLSRLAMAAASSWDVVVVGSGVGGATLALRLAQSGRRVLVVEEGDFLKLPPDAPGPVGRYIYHVLKEPGAPPIFVGGQSKFYGAALYRMREKDFAAVEHECGISPAWPISYADLEPYYGEAEQLYKVHGSAEGDPSEPPRSTPYPYPPLPHAPMVEKLVARLKRSGTQVSPIPRGLDYGPGGKCVLCATCDAHYCRLDAKMDAETAALRPALATGNMTLLTKVECLRIETDGGKATGVLLQDADGTHTVHAEIVVVSAGERMTAPLLRRSRNARFPNGLGNEGGALGRYLCGHSVGLVFPIAGLLPLPPMHSKTIAINSYHHGAPDWPYPLGIIQMAGQMPFWEPLRGATRWGAKFVGRRSLLCFYATEALPTKDTGFVFDGDRVVAKIEPVHNLKSFVKLREIAADIFRRAGYPVVVRKKKPYLWHPAGTASMGNDPSHSVVNGDCRVHGMSNLYVVDQTVLPSAGTVNTGLTIMALALRLADHIAGRQKSLSALQEPARPELLIETASS